MLINVGGAATEEHTAAAAAEQTPGKTVAIAADASTSTDFPLRAERYQKIARLHLLRLIKQTTVLRFESDSSQHKNSGQKIRVL